MTWGHYSTTGRLYDSTEGAMGLGAATTLQWRCAVLVRGRRALGMGRGMTMTVSMSVDVAMSVAGRVARAPQTPDAREGIAYPLRRVLVWRSALGVGGASAIGRRLGRAHGLGPGMRQRGLWGALAAELGRGLSHTSWTLRALVAAA